MAASKSLFSGEPLGLGGLSNEKDLVRECPEEFKRGNPWMDAAASLMTANESDVDNWKWKTGDEAERFRQTVCLQALLGSFDIDHLDKIAVAAWMLSEMLSEVPAGGR